VENKIDYARQYLSALSLKRQGQISGTVVEMREAPTDSDSDDEGELDSVSVASAHDSIHAGVLCLLIKIASSLVCLGTQAQPEFRVPCAPVPIDAPIPVGVRAGPESVFSLNATNRLSSETAAGTTALVTRADVDALATAVVTRVLPGQLAAVLSEQLRTVLPGQVAEQAAVLQLALEARNLDQRLQMDRELRERELTEAREDRLLAEQREAERRGREHAEAMAARELIDLRKEEREERERVEARLERERERAEAQAATERAEQREAERLALERADRAREAERLQQLERERADRDAVALVMAAPTAGRGDALPAAVQRVLSLRRPGYAGPLRNGRSPPAAAGVAPSAVRQDLQTLFARVDAAYVAAGGDPLHPRYRNLAEFVRHGRLRDLQWVVRDPPSDGDDGAPAPKRARRGAGDPPARRPVAPPLGRWNADDAVTLNF
jgi:hypothetical protein